jgi:hypothetical protein
LQKETKVRMEKYRNYQFSEVYKEGGFSKSYTLPDDCKKVIALYILPQFQDIDCPDGKSFLAGKISVLLNNKTDNSLHDYPVMCFPDSNGKMSNGDNYSFATKKIDIQTQIERGNVLTVVFKDSGYMNEFIEDEPLIYGNYNPGIDLYIVYEDDRGDWSNNEFDKDLNKFLPND